MKGITLNELKNDYLSIRCKIYQLVNGEDMPYENGKLIMDRLREISSVEDLQTYIAQQASALLEKNTPPT